MNKSQIVNKMIAVIKDYAEKYNLEISDKGFEDSHCIPNIIAERNTMSEEENIYIELRSFWGNPELDIRVDNNYEARLMCVNYHENEKTHEYEVNLFRVNGDDYKRNIDELESIIKFIEGEEV